MLCEGISQAGVNCQRLTPQGREHFAVAFEGKKGRRLFLKQMVGVWSDEIYVAKKK